MACPTFGKAAFGRQPRTIFPNKVGPKNKFDRSRPMRTYPFSWPVGPERTPVFSNSFPVVINPITPRDQQKLCLSEKSHHIRIGRRLHLKTRDIKPHQKNHKSPESDTANFV